jgi:predicted nucleotide-binding protein
VAQEIAAGTGSAVVVLTDDLGRAKAEAEDQPRGRQNVVVEMGFSFAALGCKRAAVLDDEIIDDVNGLVHIPLDRAGAWNSDLASELDAIGLPVNRNALGK